MLKLTNSDFGQKFRTEILDSALKAFENMINEAGIGTRKKE